MNMVVYVANLDSKLYEPPIPFLQIMFGSRMKESCCCFKDDSMTLDEAELAILELYCEREQIKDGQSILDIGCGLGTFTIYAAQKYKNCHVVGLTNSVSQKEFIEQKTKELGLSNVKIILQVIATYETEDTYDRILAIELIEHMKNYAFFLRKLLKWSTKDGLLFVEHASHEIFSHLCEPVHEDDWSMEYIFPHGTTMMPSSNFSIFSKGEFALAFIRIHDAREYSIYTYSCAKLHIREDVSVVGHWTLSGKHFARTLEEWSKRLRAKEVVANAILDKFFAGKEAATKSR